jgi:BirA family biotin operon repressor/biotin-[acetyl-CoA-carboxylase] ligase
MSDRSVPEASEGPPAGGPLPTFPSRFAVSFVADTGSTNADLLAAAADGAPDGTVLVTDHQSAGRGRVGRTWEALPGTNLLASILFLDDLDEPQLLTNRVAVAAVRACERVAKVSPDLKWPNDLLLDGAKLAGVLAEAGSQHGRLTCVVVGIGLNIGWAPPDAARLPRGTRDEVLWHLLDELDHLPDDVHAEYRRRLVTLGMDVRVELPGDEIVGQAVDVESDGQLVIETREGRRRISAGDVIHIRPAAP